MPFSSELNLTRQAYGVLVGLRQLGVIGEERFQEIMHNVFRLPEAVDTDELQEALLQDAYDRMVRQTEGILIEEQEQWGSKN